MTDERCHWTAEEDDRLRELCAADLPQRQVGAILGRNASSVGSRMKRLGIPARSRNLGRPRKPPPPVWPDMRFEDSLLASLPAGAFRQWGHPIVCIERS